MVDFAWEPWERFVEEECHLDGILKGELEFLKWEKGQCVLRRNSRRKGRPEAGSARLLRNGTLSSGAGTLGAWWEVRVNLQRPAGKGPAAKDRACRTEGGGLDCVKPLEAVQQWESLASGRGAEWLLQQPMLCDRPHESRGREEGPKLMGMSELESTGGD